MATLLLVDDESKLLHYLRVYLERDGFSVLATRTGAGALSVARLSKPDLVVLDLGLPDIPGESVARVLRAELESRILLLTGRSTEQDRISGLELGVDDYLTKPFSPRELVLRVRAILHRSGRTPAVIPLLFGDGLLSIDEGRKTVRVGAAAVELTATEWQLLTALASVPGRVYSRAELISRVHLYEFDMGERSIDSHVKNLRHKLELDPHRPRIIQTVVGMGYRLGLSRDD